MLIFILSSDTPDYYDMIIMTRQGTHLKRYHTVTFGFYEWLIGILSSSNDQRDSTVIL